MLQWWELFATPEQRDWVRARLRLARLQQFQAEPVPQDPVQVQQQRDLIARELRWAENDGATHRKRDAGDGKTVRQEQDETDIANMVNLWMDARHQILGPQDTGFLLLTTVETDNKSVRDRQENHLAKSRKGGVLGLSRVTRWEGWEVRQFRASTPEARGCECVSCLSPVHDARTSLAPSNHPLGISPVFPVGK